MAFYFALSLLVDILWNENEPQRHRGHRGREGRDVFILFIFF
jgi:hypothetical protein